MIVFMGGAGGSGKTTTSRRMKEKYPEFQYVEVSTLVASHFPSEQVLYDGSLLKILPKEKMLETINRAIENYLSTLQGEHLLIVGHYASYTKGVEEPFPELFSLTLDVFLNLKFFLLFEIPLQLLLERRGFGNRVKRPASFVELKQKMERKQYLNCIRDGQYGKVLNEKSMESTLLELGLLGQQSKT